MAEAPDHAYLQKWLAETGRLGKPVSGSDFDALLKWLPTSGWPKPPFAKPYEELAQDFMGHAVQQYNKGLEQ